MPPPYILRKRYARATCSRLPQSKLPTGQPSPLELAMRAGAPGRVDIQEADLSSVLMSLGAAAPASAAEVTGGSQR